MAGAMARILVADDSPEILALVSQRLSEGGYQVLKAADGEAALELARSEQPDVVLLDVVMPGRNGWEVARALRGDPATSAIRIVVMTALGEEINQRTAPLYGADATLAKPFDLDDLDQVIRDMVARLSAD
jgi:CheY-like chemotaxis protein